jgi:wobble nucleotide-excising tRNase
MINRFQLFRNIGLFDSVTGGANIQLSKLTLVYAENGKGKTTLAAIMRSLSSGDPIPINERKRLAALHDPQIIINCIGGPPNAIFQNGAWNRTLPNLVIFDDHFIDQNIYSGLTVASDHRQNLHELILGSQGVALNRQFQGFVDQIEIHNGALRTKAAAIPPIEVGNMTVDEFCNLQYHADIDAAILATERELAAAQEQTNIRDTSEIPTLDLPLFDIEEINSILAKDLSILDSSATEKVIKHFISLGADSERWVAEGIRFVPASSSEQQTNVCPFCTQDLNKSPLIDHYRAYFSKEYHDLKEAISSTLLRIKDLHSNENMTIFLSLVTLSQERKTFWSRFFDFPYTQINSEGIIRSWKAALNEVSAILIEKQRFPLNRMTLSISALELIAAFELDCKPVIENNVALIETNIRIQQIKLQAANSDIAILTTTLARNKATKNRYKPAIAALCDDYLTEKTNKAATETQRDLSRAALDHYRTAVFPAYQNAINAYLVRFNAGFSLGNVASANTRGGSTCNYNVVINNINVPVTGAATDPGNPSFRNTLSAGDRNTLALAFFFASLDQEPALADKVAVIDDPISSMDEHRALTTVQEIRRLAQRVSQVIVLSHSKPFLCNIWEGANRVIPLTNIQIVRDAVGSTIRDWDVNQDSITENDRRHKLLRDYVTMNAGNSRHVANAIRPVLEAFMRVAFPEHFPPGTLLGPFRGVCEQRVRTAQEIMSAADILELRELVEYANKFHHDTNAAWDTVAINDGELLGFVHRTLIFARR